MICSCAVHWAHAGQHAPHWVMLEFSTLGFIAKLLPAHHALRLASLIQACHHAGSCADIRRSSMSSILLTFSWRTTLSCAAPPRHVHRRIDRLTHCSPPSCTSPRCSSTTAKCRRSAARASHCKCDHASSMCARGYRYQDPMNDAALRKTHHGANPPAGPAMPAPCSYQPCRRHHQHEALSLADGGHGIQQAPRVRRCCW